MPLELPTGSPCFIDTNVLYFHFVRVTGVSEHCTNLLRRVEAGELTAHAAPHVLADAVHKVMLYEAAVRFERARPGLTGWLESDPERVKELRWHREAAADLFALPFRLLQPTLDDLRAAVAITAETGLLTNDALIVALMRRHGILDLATNDADFLRVPGLRVWMPR